VIAQVRDRAWRHLRDRLACAERPHGSMEMLNFLPDCSGSPSSASRPGSKLRAITNGF
jgi:hypothetical protein